MDAPHRAAIVTGGAQGIGKGIARKFLELGLHVLIADSDEEAGRETREELSSVGRIEFIQTDVSDEASVSAMVSGAAASFGRLDTLINNAGIADPDNPPVEELSLDAWNRVIGVNLTGGFLCAKHAVPHLRRVNGSIVNIASTRALMSEPNTEAYSASKGGIVALTHALAISLGPDVRVNCISPGWIDVSGWKKSSERRPADLRPEDHSQHPAGRVGRPADIASLAAFLISDQAAFITGQNYTIDGGMTRKMIYV